MEAIQPTPEEKPPSERTQAILDMKAELMSRLQDVSAEVREIKQIVKKGESWRSAAWRALTQFIGDLKNGDGPDTGRRRS